MKTPERLLALPFVLFIDLPSPLDREVEMEEEEGVQPELDDDRNVIHRCIYST